MLPLADPWLAINRLSKNPTMMKVIMLSVIDFMASISKIINDVIQLNPVSKKDRMNPAPRLVPSILFNSLSPGL